MRGHVQILNRPIAFRKHKVIPLFSTMSKAEFQLAYDGPALRNGTMDVSELASALLAVGELMHEANRVLNGDRRQLSTKVKSDFKTGSFEVFLIIDQSILEHAKDLLFPAGVTAATILVLLFGPEVAKKGAVGVATSVLDLWKKLKGEKPKTSVEDTNKKITIYQFGDGQIHVDSRIGELYNTETIRSSIKGAALPVARKGIRSLEIRKGEKVIEQIVKQDLPPDLLGEIMASSESNQARILTDTREVMLRVVRLNFEKGKWGFSDGTSNFSADIADETFRKQLDAREIGFYKGDTLRVMLTTTQVVSSDESFQSQYVIDKVIQHIHAPKQDRFEE
jgi:hypothetical protein